MPVRCMLYDALNYTDQVRKLEKEHRDAGDKLIGGEFLSDMKKEDRIVPVFSLVRYLGKKEWDGSRNLYETMGCSDDGKELLNHMRKYLPDYRINLIRGRRVDDIELFRSSLQYFFGMLKYNRDKDELYNCVKQHRNEIKNLDKSSYWNREEKSMIIKEMQIHEFLEVLSSKQPVPGGGGASALTGAIGTALGLMVGNLTAGKKKYAQVEEEVQNLMSRLIELQSDMLELADEDAKVFAPLALAYGLPAETEEQRAHKAVVMEENLLAASLVPIQIMENAAMILDILFRLEQIGSVMAISDIGVSVQCIRTALTGAVMNVYINTKSMKNREKAEDLNGYADQMLHDGLEKADQIYDQVLERLR